jgi:hypothetical protein
MKIIFIVTVLLTSMRGYSQSQIPYSEIFKDSVIRTILNQSGEDLPIQYWLLSNTVPWAQQRFHKVPGQPGQHHEGLKLYALADSTLSKLFDRGLWSATSDRALSSQTLQITAKIPNVHLVDDPKICRDSIFFALATPVTSGKYLITDLNYYMKIPPTAERDFLSQWYRGQALLVFSKDSKDHWRLIHIVNNVLR